MDRINPDNTVLAAVRAVSQLRGPSVTAILGLTRRQEVVQARNLAIYALYKTGRYSSNELGMQFGRDHTTILHSLKSFGYELHQQTRAGETLRKELAEVTVRLNRTAQEALDFTPLRRAGLSGFWIACNLQFSDPAGLLWLSRRRSASVLRIGPNFLMDLHQPVPSDAPQAIQELAKLPALGIRFLFIDTQSTPPT